MPASEPDRTYRVWGLPAGVTIAESVSILGTFCDSDGDETKPIVHSLGLDPYTFGRNVEVVAIITFSRTPTALLEGNEWQLTKSVQYQNVTIQLSLTIDTTFLGFTPLNTIKDNEDHTIDCIAVSGLSSHPFGSWKQRGGQYMWLRDSLARRSDNVRVLLYGYDTSLVRSESFQDIDDIGNKLGDFIKRIRLPRPGEINFEPRPIVFIAHSLGGLVVKEAICRLADVDWVNAHCVYGLIFFGVPNRGIRISHWLPMVNNQPNENLVRSLAPDSHYLRNLHDKFCRVFTFPTSRVVSVYETLKSKTAKEESPGRWMLTGKTEILVTRDSAMDSCPPGLKHDCMSMNQNHADLPKFRGPHDSDYQLLTMYLNDFWRDAVIDVQSRFGAEGFFTRESSPPRSTVQALYERPKTPGNVPNAQFNQSHFSQGINRYLGHSWDFESLTDRGNLPTGLNFRPMTPSESTVSHRRPNSYMNRTHIDYLNLADTPPRYEYAPNSRDPEGCQEDPQSTSIPRTVPVLELDTKASKIPNTPETHIPIPDAEITKETDANTGNTRDLVDSLARVDLDEKTAASELEDTKAADVPNVDSGHIQETKSASETAADLINSKDDPSHTCSRCKEQFMSLDALSKHLKASGHDKGDEGDDSALYLAASKGHLEVVKLLVDQGVEIKAESISKSPLRAAASKGHFEIVKFLLDNGVRIEDKSASNWTSLHAAALKGRVEIVTLLLSRGAKIEAKDVDGWTPLRAAASNGHVKIAKLLLDQGAEIETRSTKDWTPLHAAASKGHVEIVKLLLDRGAKMEAKETKTDLTPLHFAATGGHIKVAELLLGKGAKIENKDTDGWTPLRTAAVKGHVEIVRLLLDQGAEIETRSTKALWTPLHATASNGHIEIVKLLLSRDAMIEAKDSDGWTPLHTAASSGRVDIVGFLLDQGAVIEAKTNRGRTPLHITSMKGHMEVAKLLLGRGANIEAKDNDSWTPLHVAASNGQAEIVGFLLDQGAIIEAKSNSGRTPLHATTVKGHIEVAKLLLSRGANIEANNTDGWTPLRMAASNGKIEIVELLLDKGAEMEAKSKRGWTPLHAAASGGYVEIVKLLLSRGAKD